MAVLPDPDRFDVWADFMRKSQTSITLTSDVTGITKAELRAAVDAVDDWVNTNAAAFNLAIPQPARGALTASQKAALLTYVVAKRYIKGV